MASYLASMPVIVRSEKARSYLNDLSADYAAYALDGEWVTIENTLDGETHLRKAEIVPHIVPNVVGMDITDAVYLLENMGLRTDFSGQGKVKEQSLHAGDSIQPNSVIHLKLEKK